MFSSCYLFTCKQLTFFPQGRTAICVGLKMANSQPASQVETSSFASVRTCRFAVACVSTCDWAVKMPQEVFIAWRGSLSTPPVFTNWCQKMTICVAEEKKIWRFVSQVRKNCGAFRGTCGHASRHFSQIHSSRWIYSQQCCHCRFAACTFNLRHWLLSRVEKCSFDEKGV